MLSRRIVTEGGAPLHFGLLSKTTTYLWAIQRTKNQSSLRLCLRYGLNVLFSVPCNYEKAFLMSKQTRDGDGDGERESHNPSSYEGI